VVAEIRKRIPVGKGHHKQPAEVIALPDFTGEYPVVLDQFNSARFQLGTLGGGNHFIEIQKGSDGNIWIMLHSGSRNVGYTVAQRYNAAAIELNQRWRTGVPKGFDLAFLPLDTEEGKSYVREMDWCVDFAFRNRMAMMDVIESIVYDEFPGNSYSPRYNIAHNYAAMEHHFGRNVMVHRKGATRARAGEIGIIPGSQGTASYIVEGLGNPESFTSCSHGAGRAMSRSAARERLNLEVEQMLLDEQGIIHGVNGVSDLDEAPSAYKSISDVMQHQADLVRPITELKPIAVVKG
jgi:tRNA-splicing ligase RtcB